MNQEEKIIKVHLETRNKIDLMVFNFDEEKTVSMNDDNCQTELKSVFSVLLKELIIQPIKLQFEEKSEFKKPLYIDVCTEYIKELNREINTVRKAIPEKLSGI